MQSYTEKLLCAFRTSIVEKNYQRLPRAETEVNVDKHVHMQNYMARIAMARPGKRRKQWPQDFVYTHMQNQTETRKMFLQNKIARVYKKLREFTQGGEPSLCRAALMTRHFLMAGPMVLLLKVTVPVVLAPMVTTPMICMSTQRRRR